MVHARALQPLALPRGHIRSSLSRTNEGEALRSMSLHNKFCIFKYGRSESPMLLVAQLACRTQGTVTSTGPVSAMARAHLWCQVSSQCYCCCWACCCCCYCQLPPRIRPRATQPAGSRISYAHINAYCWIPSCTHWLAWSERNIPVPVWLHTPGCDA